MNTILFSTLFLAITTSVNCAQCDVQGLCLGQTLNAEKSECITACWSLCQSTEGCSWFSFDDTTGGGGGQTCILFETCAEINSNAQFVSGQKECDYSIVGRYLITGGYAPGYPSDEIPRDELTEVVELVKTNCPTPSFGRLPSRRDGGVGTMFGNVPVLCGGIGDETSLLDCISFKNSQWSQSHSMNEIRDYTTGVQINSTTFWILGGGHHSETTDSTEFIIQGQTHGIPGPKLPNALYFKTCAVKLSDEAIFVIGGEGNENEVWIYNPKNGFSRNQGPSLKYGRTAHSCSTMRDGEKTFIVVAGGWNENYYMTDSVEIYDPDDNTWHSGPSLPYFGLLNSAMAESYDGKGVLLFSGQSYATSESHFLYTHKILELRIGANSWNVLNITLQSARENHIVLPLS